MVLRINGKVTAVLTMKSYDVYILDLDDTLLYTFREATSTYYPQLAKILGLSYPGNDAVRRHWGEELGPSLERVFRAEISESKAVQVLSGLYQDNPIEPVDGIAHILDILKKHRKFIGLYSSSNPCLMALCIENSLSCKREYFDFIFSTVKQQISKPSPHIVFIMLDKYRQCFGHIAELEKVLVIGDSIADFSTARNAGVDFAGVLTGPTSCDDFLKAGLNPEHIFHSVKEVLVPPSNHGVVAIIKNEHDEFLLIKESRSSHKYIGYWSGPHGICESSDILEEQAVVRETMEECGVEVEPVRKLYTCPADTKVNTVSFWETKLTDSRNVAFNICDREVEAIAWFPLLEILKGDIPLYPGTKDFFRHYNPAKDTKNENKD